jgi:hypothetical protein
MRDEQDGPVDYRLPLKQRLILLSRTLRAQGDEPGSRLALEASSRLEGYEVADSHREASMQAMSGLVVALRQECERLRREHFMQIKDREEEIERLQSIILVDKQACQE